MAAIKEFNAPSLGLVPSEVGVEATAAAARRIGAFSNQAANAMERVGQRAGSAIRDAGEVYVKYKDHQEISGGAALGAKMFDGLVESKDNLVKSIDPTDPLYGQKVEVALKQWRDEKLEPALQKFGESFTTERSQNWAEHFVDQTREHMFHQTAADTATAAGIGVQNSAKTLANEATNTALRDGSFSTVDMQLGLAEHSISGMVQSSPMKGIAGAKVQSEVLEKVREQIVKAGAIGAIQKAGDPESVADQWIKKYPQYINGAEALQLAKNARQQIRADRADIEYNRRRAKEQAQDLSTESANQYLIDVRSRDPKLANDPTAKKILNDPNLLKADKNNLLNLIDRQVKPETDTRISNETMIDFMRELRPGNRQDLDAKEFEQRLWDARVREPGTLGSLNESHFNQLRRELADRKTPEGLALSEERNYFLSTFGAAIDGGMTGNTHSALGKQQMAKAREDMLAQEEELRRQGKSPLNLYRSKSPDYFDKDGAASKKYGVGQQSVLNYWATIGAGAEEGKKGKGLTKENPLDMPAGLSEQQAREIIPSGSFFRSPDGKVRRMP